jgi:hypothetical protein
LTYLRTKSVNGAESTNATDEERAGRRFCGRPLAERVDLGLSPVSESSTTKNSTSVGNASFGGLGDVATGVDPENRSAVLDKELQQISTIAAELDYSARAPQAKPPGQGARGGPQDVKIALFFGSKRSSTVSHAILAIAPEPVTRRR